ncbi:hypothetical protein C2R22_14285 [Salinigranum rubrum]|uniref:DUF7115 domain-containing protein n=1 Tax=Salinigranum rubrum TaxID=755307 RepID=A0A2I8VL94_9EURY|nr:hypothetical protein [Salinigranum rubrum]AUV82665.1 hypothetical protein C2R22_14285 [Salinigranum rubrum]
MSHPDIVESALGDESVAARVSLGDDFLFVTPTRTLVYRADSLLSDESIEEFPHGAERIDVSAGRRKATITLDYGLDGERSFTVPAKALDRALHPVLAGTLNASGVTDPGETVKETFRFSELTLVITSDRLVKHVGGAVWDEDFEEYHFSDVTDFAVEEGSVATTLVLTHDGRQERFKAPAERSREVSERLTDVLLAYHDVDSLETLRERFAVDEEESPSATMSFGEGPTPLSANPSELAESAKNATRHDDGGETGDVDNASVASAVDDTAATETEDASRTIEPLDAMDAAAAEGSTEPSEASAESDEADTIGTGDLLGPVDTAPPEPESVTSESDADEADEQLTALVAEVEALREAVEAQNERIAEQEELLKRLIAELRQRL